MNIRSGAGVSDLDLLSRGRRISASAGGTKQETGAFDTKLET